VWNRVLRLLPVLVLVSLLIPTTLAHAQGGSGAVVISDGSALSDTATITMAGVPAPEAGTVYEGWFVSDDGSREESTGVLSRDSDGNINLTFSLAELAEPVGTGENLFGAFDQFVVTVEPAIDADPTPSGVVAYAHKIPAAGMAHIRHLTFSSQGNPEYASGPHAGTPKGISVGLREQTQEAWTHAKLAQSSATAGDLAAAQLNACHVVNILDGYDKADESNICPGPGDGFGALNYGVDATKHAAFTRDAAPNDTTIAQFAAAVIASSNEVAEQAGDASRQAKLAMNSNDLLATALFINNVEKLLQNDTAAHTGALHSARHAYTSSQEMGTYTLASLPSVGEPLIPQLAKGVLIGGLVLLLTGTVIAASARLRPFST
jgi:hypothetical protein